MEEKEITNTEMLESLNRSFSAVQERIDGLEERFTRDLQVFKYETVSRFNDLESDLKSFRLETRDNFAVVNEKLDDLYDTDRGFDRRISRLEEKAGV